MPLVAIIPVVPAPVRIAVLRSMSSSIIRKISVAASGTTGFQIRVGIEQRQGFQGRDGGQDGKSRCRGEVGRQPSSYRS